MNNEPVELPLIKEIWRWKEVPKEPRGYYQLQGQYGFRNTRTGEYASVRGYSKVTKRKCRGKELQILREQVIDNARGRRCPLDPDSPGEWVVASALFPVFTCEQVRECALGHDLPCEWVVEAIENEVWIKW